MASQAYMQFQADKSLKHEALFPPNMLTRAKAKSAFYELRKQAANIPEMSLEEINAEIAMARAERKR